MAVSRRVRVDVTLQGADVDVLERVCDARRRGRADTLRVLLLEEGERIGVVRGGPDGEGVRRGE